MESYCSDRLASEGQMSCVLVHVSASFTRRKHVHMTRDKLTMAFRKTRQSD